MNILSIINKVLKIQEKYRNWKKLDIHLKISNGNISLKCFHFYEVDKLKGILKGMTAEEEYSYVREEREPVYCILPIDEIIELEVPELEISFQKNMAGMAN